SADSIWRRLASSAPQSRARRGLSSGSSLTCVAFAGALLLIHPLCRAALFIHNLAAQRVRERGGDPQVGESMNQPRAAGEVDHAVVAGAAAKVRRVFFRDAFDEHALDPADHALADRARLRFELRLQTVQAVQLFFMSRFVREL